MPQIQTVYLVHHSHTDIGYTHDQPILWDLQTRFVDTALRLADKYADRDSDGAFRWTVETTRVLQLWLRRAASKDIERFQALEKAGRIEVTGMFANVTPLFDTDQLIESFQIIRELRDDYGLRVEHAMNCDVNGQNWPLVDLLLDLGIRGFTMAINTHFGGALDPRPFPFLWEGPSGRTLPTYNGWTYDKGLRYGIGRDADDFADFWWPAAQKYLDGIGYPLPVLMLQSYHPFGDNGPAYEAFVQFIDDWNAAGRSPQLVFATPRVWWAAVEKHRADLDTWRGDWTDFWNFGSISSAREQAINRQSRTRLRNADALNAAVTTLKAATPQQELASKHQWTGHAFGAHREEAWRAVHLWDEHTWGADISIRDPQNEDTAAQWYHKAHYAYAGRSLSLMLQRDALAELAQYVQSDSEGDLLLVNPLPWPRTLSGEIPLAVVSLRGTTDDTTASRHSQDRDIKPWGPFFAGKRLGLLPTEVPAYGYVTIKRRDLADLGEGVAASEDAAIETERFSLLFDRERGGLISFYDKELDWEWVDRDSDLRFNGFVHEQVADHSHPEPRKLLALQDWMIPQPEIPRGWQSGWRATRTTPDRVLAHKVYRTALGITVEQQVHVPGLGEVTQRVFIPATDDTIECTADWIMSLETHPEATYLAFPFNLPDATARFDLGGQPVIPGEEQLPGACRDYFTVQGWVDFAAARRGVTVALPENPMIQLGDFHFAHGQKTFALESPLLLGWVTNNYWETNFRAHQPGRVTARYSIRPYSGRFDEAAAHRYGLEAANAPLLLQQMGEAHLATPALPAAGSLLALPEAPALPLHIKAAEDGSGVIVRLLNASDQDFNAKIGSGLLRITNAGRCDLLEHPQGDLPVVDGVCTVALPARRVTVVKLAVTAG